MQRKLIFSARKPAAYLPFTYPALLVMMMIMMVMVIDDGDNDGDDNGDGDDGSN